MHSGWAPGRFAPKSVPPGTIPPGLFAQKFERDCSLQNSGTIRSKTNLRVDSPIFIIYMYINKKIKFGGTVRFLGQLPLLQTYKLHCIANKRKTLSQTQDKRT